jgi:NAD(P)-dependent dehydrogenase (short-subunit alcohol dehydrogenase family)
MYRCRWRRDPLIAEAIQLADFNDKVILVTGAASGFGKLLAERLSAAGAKLVLGDINTESLQAVADSLPNDVVSIPCDVTSESQVKALSELAVERFGRLDIAINNAGMGTGMKSLLDTTEAEMDINFAVNTKGVFFGLKHQIPHMLKQGGGSILNVASMAGLSGAPKLASYAAAKHAVVGLTRTAAVEFAKQNVRVNAICPFFTPTPLTDAMGQETLAFVAKGSPMKRLGTADEIVTTMLSIIDPQNSYMNGQAIAVDGGVSAL